MIITTEFRVRFRFPVSRVNRNRFSIISRRYHLSCVVFVYIIIDVELSEYTYVTYIAL